jgi:hypothetical protein
VEAFAVVDLFQEVGEAVDRVLHRGVVVQVDLLVFQGLDEALDLDDVVGGCPCATSTRGVPPPPSSAARRTAPPDPSDAEDRAAGGDQAFARCGGTRAAPWVART